MLVNIHKHGMWATHFNPLWVSAFSQYIYSNQLVKQLLPKKFMKIKYVEWLIKPMVSKNQVLTIKLFGISFINMFYLKA